MKKIQLTQIIRGSITTKIVTLAFVTITVMSVVLTSISVHYINKSTSVTLKLCMEQMAKNAAGRTRDYIANKKDVTAAISSRLGLRYEKELTEPYSKLDVSMLEKDMARRAKINGFDLIFMIGADGYGRTRNHLNFNKLAPKYYTSIVKDKQEHYMSPVMQDRATLGGYVVNFSAPITSESGKFLGVVVCKINPNFLMKLMSDTKVGKGGSVFVMDNGGSCIAHKNKDMLFSGKTFKKYKDNPEFPSLNALWDTMRDTTKGFLSYEYNGERLAAFDTVPGTDNWTIAVTADKNEFMSAARESMTTSILIVILISIVVLTIVTIIINAVTKRVTNITGRIERLSKGDLTDDIVYDNGIDEVSQLTLSTQQLISEIRSIINSIKVTLSAMADGDLSVKLDCEFPGDFMELKHSVDRNIAKLADMVQHISRTADEVSRGSAQIASGATSLAQGASEQAGSVDELHHTVLDLSKQAKEIADPSRKYLDDSQDATEQDEEARIEAAPTLVDKLTAAMSCIEQRLTEVRKISAAIEHVSSETGMLALNAAVEATHAGEYGKGFAVIASEIRELSEKSAQDARNSDMQINRIMQSIDRGNKVVGFTIDSAQSISFSLSHVESALAQISTVIEGTAATAEESAAGSEELSAQAEVLKELASGFVVEQHDGKQDNTK